MKVEEKRINSTTCLPSHHQTTQKGLLTAFQRKSLTKALNQDLKPEFEQRIQIMLLSDEGKKQSQICQELGCSQATARHWITIARSGLAHTWRETPIGRPHTVTQDYLDRLKEIVVQSPREHGYYFKRWTAQWLSQHLLKEFGIEVTARHINRLLRQMGLSTRHQENSSEHISNSTLSTSSNIKIKALRMRSKE